MTGPRPRSGASHGTGRSFGVEILVALGVGAVIAALGFPLGWLWQSLAPGTPVIKVSGGAIYAQPEQEQIIAGEGWYVFLTAGAGLLFGVLVWVLLRRYRGVPVLIGTALGAIGCGTVAGWFGHWLGWGHFLHLVHTAADGTRLTMPVDLRVGDAGLWGWLPYARGDLVTTAIAATIVYLLLAGFSSRPGLRPGSDGPRVPALAAGPGVADPGAADPGASGPDPGDPGAAAPGR